MDFAEKAKSVTPCNCTPSLGSHHAECPAQIRAAVAGALREAYEAGQKAMRSHISGLVDETLILS